MANISDLHYQSIASGDSLVEVLSNCTNVAMLRHVYSSYSDGHLKINYSWLRFCRYLHRLMRAL